MNWMHRDPILRGIIKDIENPDDELNTVLKAKTKLVFHLKGYPCYKNLSPNIITELEESTTYYSFIKVLDKVYDFADENKIWIEL